MSTHYKACGHSNSNNPGEEIVLRGLCYSCKKALVGTTINFARYGKAPESGYSYNYADSKNEQGVSVYLTVDGKIAASPRWEFADERTAYIGTGIVVGLGSDDEPLVQILTIRKASMKQAAKLIN